MNDKIMEQRILEHNARNAEMVPVHIKEKRAYSVGDIMAMLDISRSSAYILIKKDFFRSPFCLELLGGFEPPTSCLPSKCSTN